MSKKKPEPKKFGALITVGGIDYEWEPYELPFFVEMELYHQSKLLGCPLKMDDLIRTFPRWAPFHTAAAVFCVRRDRGDDVLFADIAQALRWDDDTLLANFDDAAEDDAPKDQAAR